MPQRYFVTRHHGAVKWAVRHGLRARRIAMENFDPAVLKPGDVVMGTLPIHLVAEINRLGCDYWHLAMDVPPELRGRELTADDMDACHARLHEYRVLPVAPRTGQMAGPEVWGEDAGAVEPPALHLCIATGQQLPNAVPIRLSVWDRVVIFATAPMRPAAERLAAFVRDEAGRRGLPPASARAVVVDLPAGDGVGALHAAALKALRDLRRGFPAHQLVLNLTGGTKLMTLAFSEAFRGQARMLYCDSAAGVLHAVEPPGQEPVAIARDLDFPALLQVNGWRVVQGGVPDDALQAAMRQRRRLTATLALQLPRSSWRLETRLPGSKYSCFGLAALLRQAASQARETGRLMQEATRLTRDTIDDAGLVLVGHLQREGFLADGTFVEPGEPDWRLVFASEDAAEYLGSRYLEEFAWLSAEAAGVPVSHIGLGAHIDPIQALPGRQSQQLNEIDVGVAWNARLLSIECKAGRALNQAKKEQEILQKAAAVRDAAGGALSESWVISDTAATGMRAADVAQRAQMTRVKLKLGPDELATLPQAIAEWAGAGLPRVPAFDWNKQCLSLGSPRPAARGGGGAPRNGRQPPKRR